MLDKIHDIVKRLDSLLANREESMSWWMEVDKLIGELCRVWESH